MIDRLLLSGAAAVLAGACLLAGLEAPAWWPAAALTVAFSVTAVLARAAGAYDALGYGLVAAVVLAALLGLDALFTADDPAWGAFLLSGALPAGAATAIRARHVDLGRQDVHSPGTGTALLVLSSLVCLATFGLSETPVGWAAAALAVAAGLTLWDVGTALVRRTGLHVLRVWASRLVGIVLAAGVFLELDTDYAWPGGWVLGSVAAMPPLVAGWLLTAQAGRRRMRSGTPPRDGSQRRDGRRRGGRARRGKR